MNGKNRSRLAAFLVLVVAAIVVAACGGSSVPSSSAEAKKLTPAPPSASAKTPSPNVTPTPTPSPDETAKPKLPVAGEIAVITTNEGRIEDTLANDGDMIRERETLRTNGAGSLTFNLLEKIEFCNMYEDAQVRVKPSSDVFLQFDAGDFACEARPDAGPVNVLAGDDVELTMSDPQFIVSIGAQGTTIQVLRGLVDVRSISDGSSVRLGPMQSTDTSAGPGVLAPAEPWEPADVENDRLRDDLSDFDFVWDQTMPDLADSVVLDRMEDSDTIRVGVPEGLTGDSLAFVDGILAAQSEDWDLDSGPTQQVVGEQDVAAALETGTVDVFISSADLPGLGQIPLFVDPSGQQFWLYYDPGDAAFGAAQEEYLSNVVIDETYRQVYLDELGAEPIYEGFDDLVGLE